MTKEKCLEEYNLGYSNLRVALLNVQEIQFEQLLYLSIFYTWTTFGVTLWIRNSLWMMLRSGSSRHAILYVHNFQCLNCIFMAFSSVRNHKSCVLWFANDEKIV